MAWLRFGIVFAALSGCYHPNIPDGELVCGDGDRCPAGMECHVGLCYSSSTAGMYDFGGGGDMGSVVYGSGMFGKIDLTGMSGTLTLDTETGEIALSGAMAKVIVPPQTAVGGFPQVQPTSGGPKVAIWSFTELTVPMGVTVVGKPSNASVPVLAATGSLTLGGRIDVAGIGGLGGAVGMPGRPNGMSPDHGSGGGGGSDGSGGGGAGHASNGKPGVGPNNGKGGLQFGVATILPVFFGGGGGGGGGVQPATPGTGGNGGGAIVLLGHAVRISGVVDASGAAGKLVNPNSPAAAGGGGGGSGGSILVSGDSITMDAGSMLIALGGKGAAGAMGGMAGGDGAEGRIWVGSSTAVMGQLAGTPAAVTGPALTLFPR